MATEDGKGFEQVPPHDERAEEEEPAALRVEISGVSDDDLVQLLNDTADFIRSRGREGTAPMANQDAHLEVMFKRVDLGDFVILAQRS